MSTTCKIAERRLKSRCAGLIEVVYKDDKNCESFFNAKVQFLHQTVKDFLQSADNLTHAQIEAKESFSPQIALLAAQLRLLKMRQSVDLYTKEFKRSLGEIVEDAMFYARSAPLKTSRAQVALLDELDVAFTKLNERYQPEAVDLHWSTQFFRVSSHDQFTSEKWDDTFLSFAIMHGLSVYVEAKRLDSVVHKTGRPLLFYAIEDTSVTNHVTNMPMSTSLNIVQQLLEDGVDVNGKFNGRSAWQMALRTVRSYSQSSPESLELLELLHLLLSKGADPNAHIIYGTATGGAVTGPSSGMILGELDIRSNTPLDVIIEVFGLHEFPGPEVHRLITDLRAKGGIRRTTRKILEGKSMDSKAQNDPPKGPNTTDRMDPENPETSTNLSCTNAVNRPMEAGIEDSPRRLQGGASLPTILGDHRPTKAASEHNPGELQTLAIPAKVDEPLNERTHHFRDHIKSSRLFRERSWFGKHNTDLLFRSGTLTHIQRETQHKTIPNLHR